MKCRSRAGVDGIWLRHKLTYIRDLGPAKSKNLTGRGVDTLLVCEYCEKFQKGFESYFGRMWSGQLMKQIQAEPSIFAPLKTTQSQGKVISFTKYKEK